MSNLFAFDRFTILDGGMGTMLQAAGITGGLAPEVAAITHPDVVTGIHKAYIKAGADAVCTNTFGANGHKMANSGYSVEEIVDASVMAAKKACQGTNAKVALDVGPLGEMLEPAGTLAFEEAYNLFAQVAIAGEKAGADFVFIETMTDIYEVKAALLAIRENTNLPSIVSMTFEENGRTFSGTPVEVMGAVLPALGARALGINCSLGPAEIMPIAQRLCNATNLPVFVKPNAGLPNPSTGAYGIGPQEFCSQLQPILDMGISMVGGCCGTTPETIALLAQTYKGKVVAQRGFVPGSRVCSGTRMLELDAVHPIGERINPTGKKKLKQALLDKDFGYIRTLAVEQKRDGADILDVNVGAPGVDEVEMLPKVVKAVQSVSDLPLQLDSANPKALEAALRVYNGKAIVNSTSGEKEKLAQVLPICKKYGAAVVGLALDEDGIPETAEGRLVVAQKIYQVAIQEGIPQEDIYIDCLTLATSAMPGAAIVTLQAVSMVKQQLGLKTVLGVSNISFGLPARPVVNQTFLSMAMQAGLDLPIMNPADGGMRGAVAAFNMLQGKDENATHFVAQYAGSDETKRQMATVQTITLADAIEQGLKEEASRTAAAMLQSGQEGMELINGYLMPALDKVGQGFEKGTLFLPQLLAAAGAAGAAFDVIKAAYGDAREDGPPVVIATVKGDIHDIGKNIVKVLLENYGFKVIDLGRDVPVQEVVDAARQSGAKLVGLSALMTTTLPSMAETIAALRQQNIVCKVVVGGAVLTPEYAMQIGADYYTKDAMRSVEVAKEVYGLRR